MLARSLVAAGQIALSKFRTPLKTWTKGKGSPVTEVDMAVDDFLRERLAGALPDCAWLSEESADDGTRSQSNRLWIVDPIDGTRAFIAGLPDWAIVAALVEGGRPICSAIYAPATDQLFLAAAGRGATLNRQPLRTSAGAVLDGMRVSGPPRRVEALARLVPTLVRCPRVHSLALRLARVATGEYDVALIGPSSHDWDLAAADLLVHEAGGALTTLEGQPPAYNWPDPVHPALIAAGRRRHAALLQLVGEHRSEFA
jgi:myo-inositol-1(or 4)-monophosphatase